MKQRLRSYFNSETMATISTDERALCLGVEVSERGYTSPLLMADKKIKKLTNKQIGKICNRAFDNFNGLAGNLNSAMGMLHVGNRVGWRTLLIMFDKKTIKRNENILGVKFKEILPEEGDCADKSVAWSTYKKLKLTNFWKVVSGDIKGVKTPKLEQ